MEPDSIGDELGIQPGDRLLSINGIRPRDLIDFQFLVTAEDLTLEVQDPDGTIHVVELEKDADEGLGLSGSAAPAGPSAARKEAVRAARCAATGRSPHGQPPQVPRYAQRRESTGHRPPAGVRAARPG